MSSEEFRVGDVVKTKIPMNVYPPGIHNPCAQSALVLKEAGSVCKIEEIRGPQDYHIKFLDGCHRKGWEEWFEHLPPLMQLAFSAD